MILQYFIRNNLQVNGIIDNDAKLIGSSYEGIPIIPFSKIESNNFNIFIAIESDKSTIEIKSQIHSSNLSVRVLKWKDLYTLMDL